MEVESRIRDLEKENELLKNVVTDLIKAFTVPDRTRVAYHINHAAQRLGLPGRYQERKSL